MRSNESRSFAGERTQFLSLTHRKLIETMRLRTKGYWSKLSIQPDHKPKICATNCLVLHKSIMSNHFSECPCTVTSIECSIVIDDAPRKGVWALKSFSSVLKFPAEWSMACVCRGCSCDAISLFPSEHGMSPVDGKQLVRQTGIYLVAAVDESSQWDFRLVRMAGWLASRLADWLFFLSADDDVCLSLFGRSFSMRSRNLYRLAQIQFDLNDLVDFFLALEHRLVDGKNNK